MLVRGRLNDLLNSRGMSQKELSERTGIPQGSISRFDRNERHSSKHLILISRELSVHVEELFSVYEEVDEESEDTFFM